MTGEIEQTVITLLVLAGIGGYLLGSVPFGLILTRLAGISDIRKTGSGNIGATNVLRAGGKKLAALTLLLDAGKGAVAVLLAMNLVPDVGLQAGVIAGAGAFLGHLYPVWLRFKGGKGVATFLGILLAIAWPVGLACCLTWLATAAIMRISSLSALVAAALSPVFAWYLGSPEVVMLTVAMAILIYLRHIENIRRLLRGEESSINKS